MFVGSLPFISGDGDGLNVSAENLKLVWVSEDPPKIDQFTVDVVYNLRNAVERRGWRSPEVGIFGIARQQDGPTAEERLDVMEMLGHQVDNLRRQVVFAAVPFQWKFHEEVVSGVGE